MENVKVNVILMNILQTAGTRLRHRTVISHVKSMIVIKG